MTGLLNKLLSHFERLSENPLLVMLGLAGSMFGIALICWLMSKGML